MSINSSSNSWGSGLGYLWVSTLCIAIIGFALSVYIARALGVQDFGNYSYILSLAGILLIFQDGGYKTLIFRESVDDLKLSSMRFGVAHVITITIIGSVAILLFQPEHWLAILTAFCCMALLVLNGFVSSLLRGKGDFKSDAIWRIFVRTLSAFFILLVLVFYDNDSVTSLFVGWSLALVLTLIWPVAKGYLKWPSFSFKGELFRNSMVFLTIDVATVFYFRSDIVLLEYFGHIQGDVGQYSAAYRILEGIILLATPVAQIAFRSLRLRQNQNDFFGLLSRLVLIMFMVASIITIIGIFFGNYLMLILFGEQYQFAGDLLPILLFAMLFILPNYILTQGSIALNKEIYYAKIVVSVAIINIGLNIWLIPDFGAMGAAWATIFSEGLLCFALGWVLWREWIGGDSANWG